MIAKQIAKDGSHKEAKPHDFGEEKKRTAGSLGGVFESTTKH